MHDRPYQMLPNAGALPDVEEAANRVQLVKRYNCLVGKPGNITRTIQKQFLMGFMSKDEIESLRKVYLCVINAMETAIHLCPTDDVQS